MKRQIASSTNIDVEREIKVAFNDFVDIDIMENAVSSDQYNTLVDATDRLLEQVLDIVKSL